MGFELNWDCVADRNACYIDTSKKFDKLLNGEKTDKECLTWLFNMASKFYEVFPQYLRKYK